MKSILITGANSYIGQSFEKYLKQWPECYGVDTLDMVDNAWQEKDFNGYDSVFHVAGIAHQKETNENTSLYFEVNRDLTLETARKAKSAGCRQFVFLSSMSVYGLDAGVITPATVPKPKTNYGKSKLEAEQMLRHLDDKDFCVCIVRPPMVYGKGCKGNFQSLLHFARTSSFFPQVNNQRSMIFIDRLCEFVRQIVDREDRGLFFPQNPEYMQTSQMIQWLGEAMGQKIVLSPILGVAVKCLYPFSRTVRKAFGSLTYQGFNTTYCLGNSWNSETSVKQSI